MKGILDYLIILGCVGCIFLLVTGVYTLIDKRKKVKRFFRGHNYYHQRFKSLVKYGCYGDCAESYIFFLLSENVCAKKIMRLQRRAYPEFERVFLMDLLHTVYDGAPIKRK